MTEQPNRTKRIRTMLVKVIQDSTGVTLSNDQMDVFDQTYRLTEKAEVVWVAIDQIITQLTKRGNTG